jgi:hypothetical protein
MPIYKGSWGLWLYTESVLVEQLFSFFGTEDICVILCEVLE